jgi:ribosome-binding ATPase
MGLTAGIIGLPNVGKSTIFNSLTSGRAAMENYPFCTIEPNHGVTAIPDTRLERISGAYPAGKVVPAFLELVDIAGLVKGASRGEGLGNQFLGHIKEVDALLYVVRCFEAPDVVHVDGSIDAVRDCETIETELLLKDLETVERSIARNAKAVQTGNKELGKKVGVLEKVAAALGKGIPARRTLSDEEEFIQIADLHLLTVKPVIYAANIGDSDDNPAELKQLDALNEYARVNGSAVVPIRGSLESEIMQLSEDERDEYYTSLGIKESGLAVLARSLYELLGLISFFTVNSKELHTWTIRNGSTAVDAAGAVHTDFAKGFVKADVYSVDDLDTHRTESALRAAGKIRSEGRDYIVRDGDIIFIKAAP